jgi:branched-chain amino acid transport system permease protein
LPALNLGVITIDISKVDFLQYQFLLYGLALVGMMLLRPEGLFPNRRRQRELHDTDDSAAANEELAQA